MNRQIALSKKITVPSVTLKKVSIWLGIWVFGPVMILYLLVGSIAADKLTKPLRVFNNSYTPAIMNLPFEEITFSAKDGEAKIAAWYIPSVENTRALILVHGRNASRTDFFLGHSLELASILHRAGFSVMLIDLRGHGQSSDGRFTFGLKERNDVMGAVDWLMTKGFQPGKIGVMGISLGSSAAIGAAADDPRIGALVSDSGFAEILPMIQSRWQTESGLPLIFLDVTRLMIWLRYGYDVTASKPDAEISSVSPRPILLIHCADDKTIPYDNVLQLKAAAPGAELWTIPSCTHGQSYNADPIGYQMRLVKFFQAGLR